MHIHICIIQLLSDTKYVPEFTIVGMLKITNGSVEQSHMAAVAKA